MNSGKNSILGIFGNLFMHRKYSPPLQGYTGAMSLGAVVILVVVVLMVARCACTGGSAWLYSLQNCSTVNTANTSN